MKNKVHETIIIGAGISGLACARKLHENGKEFLVISEDIGGRILTSGDEKVNYGCYFIMDDYYHTKHLIKKSRIVHRSKTRFHKGSRNYGLYDKRLLIYLPQWIRLLLLIYKFRKHYAAFKKRCETVSQAQAIKSNPFLYRLYHQTAKEFIQEYRIEKVAEDYLSLISYAFTISPIHETRALTLLHIATIAVVPSYEFTYSQKEMIKELEKNITIDSVVQIAKNKNQYLVKTKKRDFWAKNVVVATPPHISIKLLHLKKANKPTTTHMFHVSGKPRDFLKDFHLNFFSDTKDIFSIYTQIDGSYVVYSKIRQPKFKKYFKAYKVIKHKFWSPALNSIGHVLWECEQDKNLYLIGDHNECCLEDAHVTGLYAANRIINSEG